MSDQECCPRCNGATLLTGVLWGQVFAPYGRSPWNPGVAAAHSAQACLSCGYVWSHLSPAILRSYLRDYGGKMGRQFLDEIEHGPYRDLPDTELGRLIGDRVSEIDALIRSGNTGKAVRRYREMRGVIWDQAVKDVGSWAERTRSQKLALFGWIPKKEKKPYDDLL